MKTYKRIVAIATFIAAASAAGIALAQTSTSTSIIPTDNGTSVTQTTTLTTPGQYPAPMVVDIDNSGNALVRGVVQSVTADTITVQSWGGTWIIRTGANSVVFSQSSDLTGIGAGDFVGAQGTVAPGETAVLNATIVRDWTTNPFTGATNTSGTSSDTGSSSSGTGAEGTSQPGTDNAGGTSAPSGSGSSSLNLNY